MRKILLYLLTILAVGVGGFGGFVVNNVGAEGGSISDELPEIFIKAVNPGYTIDGKSNVGEMIVISRKNSDDVISLAGMAVSYTNTSGEQTLVEFSEHSFMAGENILLRLASSPGSELSNLTYKVKGTSSGLTQSSGPVVLKKGDEVIDSVCWVDGQEGCYRKFKSGSGESLVRNLETGEFEFRVIYEPMFNPENYYVEDDGMGEVVGPSQCKNLEFSEILSFYETSKSEQFIEFYNRGSEQILLDGCVVRYKNKKYELKGVVRAEEYFVFYPNENGFSLTKNPTNSNTLELVDTDGVVVDLLEYPNGQRKGTSYALIGYDTNGKEVWHVTYAPTPGAANNYQEFKNCEEGKVLNKETGNCVKVAALANKICKEGQYLNILTGRCKKIETESEKTCKEGYYLNPETGRCRKIKENDGADYSLEPENYQEESSFVALYAVIGVVLAALLYLGFEFRHEIWKLVGRVFRRFR